MKKLVLFLFIIMGIVIVLLLVLCSIVWITGKGKIAPFLDEKGDVLKGSVAERIMIDVNGTENGLIIRGKDSNNPVILFISGGPGVPDYWLNDVYAEKYPNRLEEEYTVCWWDYVGEGLSYDSDLKSEDITVERLASDAKVVTEYLKARFGTEKVYLMAHSSGTNLGMYLAQTEPDLFYCYFAQSQDVTKGIERYQTGYDFMKKVFEESGNVSAMRDMNRLVNVENGVYKVASPDTIEADWEGILLKAGCATTREMRSDALDIFFPQMFSSCYTFSEKIDYWRGKFFLSKSPYAKYHVDPNVPAQIPVYFLSGYYDYTTPVSLVQDLYEKLEAPEKAMYIFHDSAHSPLWEENDKVMEILKKYTR